MLIASQSQLKKIFECQLAIFISISLALLKLRPALITFDSLFLYQQKVRQK